MCACVCDCQLFISWQYAYMYLSLFVYPRIFFNPHSLSMILFQATSAPIFRMQENSPQFRLNNLEPGREYQFSVYAVNAKGRSEPPVVIERVRVAAQLGPYGEYSCRTAGYPTLP